jgi:hypothetical protein
MRVLVAIPHFFGHSEAQSVPNQLHGSVSGDPRPRVTALSTCITALHQLYGRAQRIIDQVSLRALHANGPRACDLQIVVCTTGERHLVRQLSLPADSYRHHETACEPPLLGFESHAVLREGLGNHDFFVYMEDDLICRDPWLFEKLAWFNAQLGDGVLLQPNRYEVRALGFVTKAYIDGDIARSLTARYQDPEEVPRLSSMFLGIPIGFNRPANPHSGCFFLNARQMSLWASQPYFLDRDTGFVGPLESAATLGIMRTFRVYKPEVDNASFLEIEHFGSSFISQLRLA